ncbi:MAG: UDP-glucose/GDP-mannose dehydrogenase family protein [Gemmatimonadaceae bacterium]|nr:UDP-glucose/GDP-mannose dehydrogenase family protein [Gemmatimonadaceae bacterium]
MKISIFGLGYVGTVCAGCLASEKHTVVGVDVNAAKVEGMNAGIAPIVEPQLPELFSAAHKAGLLSATTSAADAVMATEISLVCVGTPSRDNGGLDLSYMKRVCEEIGDALRTKSTPHVVVLRSTMLPGTTEDLLVPILEKHSGKKVGEGFTVCYNPEFLREGSSVYDFYNPPKIVVGESAPGAGDALLKLYAGIEAPTLRTSIRVAEMAKYCDNAFHALKVSFANEVGNLCKKLGVDSHDVMAVFCEDKKLNLSPAYLKPGFAFGGSCLPKDLRALAYEAKRFDLDSPLINAILESNEAQIQTGIRMITSLGKKRVGFLGMAFKPDTDDMRESPLVSVIETLLGKGYAIRIYDRNVSTSRLIGANRKFIDEHIPHLSSLLVEKASDLIATSDILVVGYKSPEFVEVLQALRPDQIVVDLARLAPQVTTPARYEGICW